MNFVKKPIFIIGTIVLAAIAGAYFYFSRGETKPEFVTVKKGDIVSEVSVTGHVKPLKSVDLAFEKNGRVSAILSGVGGFVYAGQTLVKQDDSELSAQLSEAEADLATKKAELNKSEIVLNNYYLSIIDVLNDAYTKADDAVKNQADSMFSDGDSNAPKLVFSTTDYQAQTDSQNGRLLSKTELNNWRQEITALGSVSSVSELDLALQKSQNHLAIVRDFLLKTMDALNKAGISQATIDAYKASITTARTNINTVLTNITSQKQDIDSQKATVASDEVAIKSYEASIKNIEAQISKTVLYSPISGIVTKQDAKVGEIAAAGTILVSVITASQFEIETYIPEVDISKIKIGDISRVTLDAYGKDVSFEAKVSAIDPAETIMEGVATYKATLRFVTNDKLIKSGMTANLDIMTAAKDNVLIIPQRAIATANGDKFVNLYDPTAKDGKITKVKIVTGLRGSDGNVEILEGLMEGDRVVTGN